MLSIHCLFHNNLSRTIRPLGAELGITLLRVAASCCELLRVARSTPDVVHAADCRSWYAGAKGSGGGHRRPAHLYLFANWESRLTFFEPWHRYVEISGSSSADRGPHSFASGHVHGVIRSTGPAWCCRVIADAGDRSGCLCSRPFYRRLCPLESRRLSLSLQFTPVYTGIHRFGASVTLCLGEHFRHCFGQPRGNPEQQTRGRFESAVPHSRASVEFGLWPCF